MISSTSAAPWPSMNVPGHAWGDGSEVSSDPLQQAACEALATRGQWNNQFMDLVTPLLTQLPIWPPGQGLVIIQGEKITRYNAHGEMPVAEEAIDYENDIVLEHVGGNHYNGRYHEEVRKMPGDGDCLFRAIITGWHHGRLSELAEEGYILELREHVATYVAQNWDAVQAFVDRRPEGEEARRNQLMDGILKAQPSSRFDTLVTRGMLSDLLAPAITPTVNLTPQQLRVPALALSQINDSLIQSPNALKNARSERCLRLLFGGNGAPPPSMAESILIHRHAPEFKEVVNKLLDLMHSVACELQGEAREHFALVLGVSTAPGNEDWGMAQEFLTQDASTPAMAEFKQRFAAVRDEFGMSF